MIGIFITGARGRMGQAVWRAAEKTPEVKIAGKIDRGEALEALPAGADVVVDFSGPAATVSYARLCALQKKSLVIGTTGHDVSQREELRKISGVIPMVWSSNFSTGVNVLFWLTEKAGIRLGPEFDVEIVEMHHRAKKDAPSGTARALAEILARARGASGAAINIHSLRGGDVVGDHKVIFAAAGERVELAHKASTRDTFAAGALRAAQWVAGKPPGLYDMRDVLGLS